MTVIKKGFEKEFVADVITDRNKEGVLTSRVSGKVTDDETKSTLSGNSLHSLPGAAGADDERSAFTKTSELEILLVKRGKRTNVRT